MEGPKHCLWPSSWRCQLPRSHGIALPPKENPFLPSLTAFVGGQEQVCADKCTGIIDCSNKKLHQSRCCADCFPSCRSMWLDSCPCSATLGWLVAQGGSDAHPISTPGCCHSHFWEIERVASSPSCLWGMEPSGKGGSPQDHAWKRSSTFTCGHRDRSHLCSFKKHL